MGRLYSEAVPEKRKLIPTITRWTQQLGMSHNHQETYLASSDKCWANIGQCHVSTTLAQSYRRDETIEQNVLNTSGFKHNNTPGHCFSTEKYGKWESVGFTQGSDTQVTFVWQSARNFADFSFSHSVFWRRLFLLREPYKSHTQPAVYTRNLLKHHNASSAAKVAKRTKTVAFFCLSRVVKTVMTRISGCSSSGFLR